MRMEIRSRNRVSNKLRSSIERRLRFVLGRFAGRVSRVTIRLAEVHGARGKTTKRCKILVQLNARGQVSVEDTDVDFQTAADRATGRVGQTVQRLLERRQAVKAHARQPA
jgi:ribosome-associated translation inhibitor RaiA